MPKRIALFLTILFLGQLVLPFSTYPSLASGPDAYINQIKIDGARINLDPPAIISSGRTLVPVYFLASETGLNGSVSWDSRLRKVVITSRGHTVELFIGKKTASVDGKSCTLDAAPQIWQNRTYIPLAFMAQSLGGSALWNGVTREVSINFGYKPRVFAYYYYSPMEEMKANRQIYTDIAFRWLEADGSGNLSYEYKDQYREKVSWVRQQGIAAHASVALMDREQLHQLLTSPANRSRLIQQLKDLAYRENYDGINIDFEFIPPEDKAYYTLFLQELKAGLGADKTLSAAVFARTGKEKWATPYDYQAIGLACDLVVVMSYDYSYLESKPGPVAPFWWVQQVGEYMSQNMAAEKVLLGLATYGYDWGSDGEAKTITASKLKDIQSRYKVTAGFDQASLSPYYTYYDEHGHYHQIWTENQASLEAKWTLCREQKLGGAAFWRIGTGFMDIYRVLGS